MSDLVKTPERLKQSILQEAMQGKLTKQLPSDDNVNDLLNDVKKNWELHIKNHTVRSHKLMPASNAELFAVPNNWKFVRIYDVASIESGFPFKKRMYRNTGARLIRITDFNEQGFVNKALHFVTYNDVFKKYLLKSGDILMAMNGGTVGKTSPALKISRKMLLYQRIARFRSMGILPQFLDYYLKSPFVKNKLHKHVNPATIGTISMTLLRKLYMPIPPLSEQHRIVQRLNEILPKVDDLNKDVVKLDQIRTKFPHRLKQSLLLEAMKGYLTQQLPSDGNADDLLQKIQQKKQQLIRAGKIRKHKKLSPISKNEIPFEIPKNWKWVRLSSLYDFIGGSQPYKKYFIKHQRIGYIRLYQVRDYGPRPRPVYIPKEKARKISRVGDILISRYGTGSIGKVFKARYGAYNVALAKVTPVIKQEELDMKYIWYYLKSNLFQYFTHSLNRSVITRPGFNKKDLEKLVIPVPPLSEQHRIVSKLHDLFNTINS